MPRLLLQSVLLAVGAWLVIHQVSTPGMIIAGSIMGDRALDATGVITASDPVMLIVPESDTLMIEPKDIDQVQLGLPVLLRFSAFNMRTTPEIIGPVVRVGADSTRRRARSSPRCRATTSSSLKRSREPAALSSARPAATRRRPRATTPKQHSTPGSLFAARTRDRFWSPSRGCCAIVHRSSRPLPDAG